MTTHRERRNAKRAAWKLYRGGWGRHPKGVVTGLPWARIVLNRWANRRKPR